MMNVKEDPENDIASSKSTADSVNEQDDAPQPPLKTFAKTLWRTRLCKHFMKGQCRYGNKCGFAHSEEGVNQRPNLIKTRLCSRFQKGYCQKGENCQFAHGLDELKVVDIVENAPIITRSKDEKLLATSAKSAEKEASPMPKAVPLDEPMKLSDLEPMKCPLPSTHVNLYDGVTPIIPPPQNLPPTKLQYSTAPKSENRKPDMNMKPFHLQRDSNIGTQSTHCYVNPPGLRSVHDTLLECQRLRQDLKLDDTPQLMEDANLHRELGAMRGLVNNLKGNVWDPRAPASRCSQSTWEQNFLLGSCTPNMENNKIPFGGYPMAKYNYQKGADQIDMQKYNHTPGANGAWPMEPPHISMFANLWSDN